MDNYIFAECHIFRGGFAVRGFDLNLSTSGINETFEFGTVKNHKRLFEIPFTTLLVKKFFEPEFSVRIFEYGKLDFTDSKVAYPADITVEFPCDIRQLICLFNFNLRSFIQPVYEQIN